LDSGRNRRLATAHPRCCYLTCKSWPFKLARINAMVILIAIESYLPGWKYGGPVRSLSALVEALGDEFRFKIVTRDRDFKEKQAYPDVVPNRWQRVGKADVLYLTPRDLSLRSFQKVIAEVATQVIYLNSFFSP